jgi:hypothetical protein
MIGSKIALYANHNKIQQSHVQSCCLIKILNKLWILTQKNGWQNQESTSKEKKWPTI